MQIKNLIICSLGMPAFLISSATHAIATTPWVRHTNNLVINPSQFRMPPTNELGFNTADPCVIFDSKLSQWHAYFSSMILSQDIQVIKHAKSSDGMNWTVQSSPALEIGTANNWDSKSVETCSIVSVEVSPEIFKYYLYYSGTDTSNGGDTDVYKIGLAVSDNLNTFTRIPSTQSPKGVNGLLFDQSDAFSGNLSIVKGVVTDPDVLYQDGKFLMWYYCAGANNAGQYLDGGICHATSDDGILWSQKGTLPSLLNYDTAGVVAQQPTVIYNNLTNTYEMWIVIDDPKYASYGVPGIAVGGYYKAFSVDGKNWTYVSKTAFDFKWSQNIASENKGLANGPEVVFLNGIYYLFYSSFTDQGIPPKDYFPFTWGLNLATRK